MKHTVHARWKYIGLSSQKLFLSTQGFEEKTDPVNDNNQTLDDLFTMIGHTTPKFRQSALLGMKNLFQKHHFILYIHLGDIIKKIVHYLTDPSDIVRSALKQLFSSLFTILNENNSSGLLHPFLPILHSHFHLGLSHPRIEIFSSTVSCVFLTLKYYPALFSSQIFRYLSHFRARMENRVLNSSLTESLNAISQIFSTVLEQQSSSTDQSFVSPFLFQSSSIGFDQDSIPPLALFEKLQDPIATLLKTESSSHPGFKWFKILTHNITWGHESSQLIAQELGFAFQHSFPSQTMARNHLTHLYKCWCLFHPNSPQLNFNQLPTDFMAFNSMNSLNLLVCDPIFPIDLSPTWPDYALIDKALSYLRLPIVKLYYSYVPLLLDLFEKSVTKLFDQQRAVSSNSQSGQKSFRKSSKNSNKQLQEESSFSILSLLTAISKLFESFSSCIGPLISFLSIPFHKRILKVCFRHFPLVSQVGKNPNNIHIFQTDMILYTFFCNLFCDTSFSWAPTSIQSQLQKWFPQMTQRLLYQLEKLNDKKIIDYTFSLWSQSSILLSLDLEAIYSCLESEIVSHTLSETSSKVAVSLLKQFCNLLVTIDSPTLPPRYISLLSQILFQFWRFDAIATECLKSLGIIILKYPSIPVFPLLLADATGSKILGQISNSSPIHFHFFSLFYLACTSYSESQLIQIELPLISQLGLYSQLLSSFSTLVPEFISFSVAAKMLRLSIEFHSSHFTDHPIHHTYKLLGSGSGSGSGLGSTSASNLDQENIDETSVFNSDEQKILSQSASLFHPKLLSTLKLSSSYDYSFIMDSSPMVSDQDDSEEEHDSTVALNFESFQDPFDVALDTSPNNTLPLHFNLKIPNKLDSETFVFSPEFWKRVSTHVAKSNYALSTGELEFETKLLEKFSK